MTAHGRKADRRKGAPKATSGRKPPPAPKKDKDLPAGPLPQRDPDEHPYAPNSVITVRWSDESERFCSVVEKQRDAASQWRYYVHYHDFNRRMDEWVGLERVVKVPSVATPLYLARKAQNGHHDQQPANEAEEMEPGEEVRAQEPKRKRRRPDMEAGGDAASDAPTVVADMDHDEHEGMDEASLKEHEEVTKIKNVERVELGDFCMDTWYFSPYPKELFPEGSVTIPCLFICEYSFRFFRHREELLRYQRRHRFPRHPPGQEIYRLGAVSVFEVDGLCATEYCQNLSYFAKLFLDHKTLYYDVDPFLFYVVTEFDDRGYHPVGYFSKEKHSDLGYNLACILTFPCHQRKGYGRFIIAFSYELSKREQRVGSPEKPLSDLGAVSYRSYWCRQVLLALRKYPTGAVSVMDLSKLTSITPEDIVTALQYLGLLRYSNGSHFVVAAPHVLDQLLEKYPAKGLQVDAARVHWAPYITPEGRHDKWNIAAKVPASEESHT